VKQQRLQGGHKVKKIFLLLLFLIIAGCTPTGTNQVKLEKDLYKGTEGVTLDLFDDKLPSEVYQGETLNYIVKATNKGPYPVNNAKLVISLEKGYMSFINPMSPSNTHIKVISNIDLEGKTLFNTLDDFEVREESIKSLPLDGQSEYHDSLITTNFCYDYKGIAVADVCIDTDPYSIRPGQKVCTVKDSISLSEGQGGPVLISQIDTRMLVDNFNGKDYIRPQFILHIINQGQGFVIKPGTTDKVCSENALQSDVYNSVIINNIKFSSYTKKDFDCFPEELVLMEDQDKITCILKTGAIAKESASYTTPLEVEISYGYMFSQSKEIKIKKVLRY
jgi:uncharacterized repeat protein (TIGR01451 family)